MQYNIYFILRNFDFDVLLQSYHLFTLCFQYTFLNDLVAALYHAEVACTKCKYNIQKGQMRENNAVIHSSWGKQTQSSSQNIKDKGIVYSSRSTTLTRSRGSVAVFENFNSKRISMYVYIVMYTNTTVFMLLSCSRKVHTQCQHER